MVEFNAAFGKLIGGAGTVVTVLFWISIGLIALAIIGSIILWRWNRKRYIYTTEIWGSYGGIPDVLIVDKARPVKIRTKEGISSLLYLKKLKRYIKNPPRDFFIGNKARFWFRKDGELTPIRINKPLFQRLLEARPLQKEQDKAKLSEDADCFVPYVLEDVNARFEASKVEFINEDMRLAHVSTGKIIREMFNIEKFLQKHGATLLMILGVMVMAISIILILDGAKDYYGSGSNVQESAEKFIERMDKSNQLAIQTIEELHNLRKEINPSIPPLVTAQPSNSTTP